MTYVTWAGDVNDSLGGGGSDVDLNTVPDTVAVELSRLIVLIWHLITVTIHLSEIHRYNMAQVSSSLNML